MLNYKQRPTFQYQNDTIPFLQLKSPRPCINAWDSGKFKVQSQTCLCDGDGLDHNIGEKHPISGVLSQKFGKSPAIFFNFFSLLEISDRIFFSNLFFFSAFKMNIFSLKFFILTCICTKKTFSPPDFLAVNENASDFEKKKGKKNENYTDLYMYIIKYIYPQHSHLILH